MDGTTAVMKNIRHRETTDDATREAPSASMIRTEAGGAAATRANVIMATGTEIGVGTEVTVIGHSAALQIDTTTEDNISVLVARTDAQRGQQTKEGSHLTRKLKTTGPPRLKRDRRDGATLLTQEMVQAAITDCKTALSELRTAMAECMDRLTQDALVAEAGAGAVVVAAEEEGKGTVPPATKAGWSTALSYERRRGSLEEYGTGPPRRRKRRR